MTAEYRAGFWLAVGLVAIIGVLFLISSIAASQHQIHEMRPATNPNIVSWVSPEIVEHPVYNLNSVIVEAHGPTADNDGVITTASDGRIIRDADGKYAIEV